MTFCTTRAQAVAEMREWLTTALGVSYTGQWGNQCARATQRYAEIIFGGNYGTHHGYGNAVDVIDNASTVYFDKYWYQNGFVPEPGDIIIWKGAAPLWDGKYYGHIAVVESATASRVTVLQQDGAAAPTVKYADGYYYSAKPVHRASFGYRSDAFVGDCRGWLRPKTAKMLYTGADTRGYGTGVASASATTSKTTATQTGSTALKIKNFIDVSDYQPTSVITAVNTDAVSIKASEGVSWTSKNMAGHIEAARRKNIPYSLYHFARGSKNDSDSEAAHFLKAVKPYLSDPLLNHLVLDWEEDGLTNYNQWAEDFLRAVEKGAPGKRRVIYTRLAFLNGRGWTSYGKSHSIWLAWYGSNNTFSGYATNTTEPTSFTTARKNGWHIAAWQYSDRGRLTGYGSDLDLNTSLAVQDNMHLWSTNTPTLLEWIMSNQDTVKKIMQEAIKAEKGTIAKAVLDEIVTLKGDKNGMKSSLRTKIEWMDTEYANIRRNTSKRLEELASSEDEKFELLRAALQEMIAIKEEDHELPTD